MTTTSSRPIGGTDIRKFDIYLGGRRNLGGMGANEAPPQKKISEIEAKPVPLKDLLYFQTSLIYFRFILKIRMPCVAYFWKNRCDGFPCFIEKKKNYFQGSYISTRNYYQHFITHITFMFLGLVSIPFR